MIRRSIRTRVVLLALAAVTAATAGVLTLDTADRYVTASPSLTHRFLKIPSEASLLDFCSRLREQYGVTGVSYRDYSPATGSAVITVFYNPHRITTRQIRVFLHNSNVFWATPLMT